jgi:hypothetical protein
MKKLNALLFLLSLSWLCGCSLAPGENSDGIDMEEWCNRDVRMPWTGCWTEVAQLDCQSGQEFVPEATIGEFRLTSDGIFSVAWSPFETYVDYAGQYEVREKNGAIQLAMGDRAPPGAEGQGHFTITDQGELILEDIWLGAREQENVTKACGHKFRMRTAHGES